MIIDDAYIEAAVNIISHELSQEDFTLPQNINKALIPLFWAYIVIKNRKANKAAFQKAKTCHFEDAAILMKNNAKISLDDAKNTYNSVVLDVLQLEKEIFNNE